MPKIVSIGNTCLDIILRHAQSLPRWGTEILFEESEWRLGGQGANFAIAARYLGLKPILISSIGTDDVGTRLRTELASAVSINKPLFTLEDSETGFSVTLVRHDGERSFFTFLGHQNLFTTKPIMRDILSTVESNDVVHVSGLYMLPKLREELISLFRRLHSKGARISFDPGWNPNGFSKASEEDFYRILSYVDFFEPNEEELKQLSGETTIQSAIRRIKPRFQGVLAVKLGWKGSKIVEPSDEGRYIPSFLTRVADTTAAGDVFDAGFITGIVRNDDLRLCAKMGNAAASIAISRRGKTSLRFPKLSEVQSLIDHG